VPILELCAGYGGLGCAVEELTGEKVSYVAEVDEAASKILAHRFPGVPNIGDITTIDWEEFALTLKKDKRRHDERAAALTKEEHGRLHAEEKKEVVPYESPVIDIITAGFP
jgi:site-specific DNA-cytosine methylase